LNFGTPGATTGVRAVSAGTSSVTLGSQDGLAVGSLTSTTFDANGALTTVYSNGQTVTHQQLALAGFSDLQRLTPLAGNLFGAPSDAVPTLGVANTKGLGAIATQQIEIANVDLAQEFGALIISQRGYQASSQVISTANDMIQQLFDAKGRR
jgi:flagellar hook protein FlgE